MMKMTFRKKDPELVTLFFADNEIPGGKPRQYRVSKRQEFINALQVIYTLFVQSKHGGRVDVCACICVYVCHLLCFRSLLYVCYDEKKNMERFK
jgi:hypothetical protein